MGRPCTLALHRALCCHSKKFGISGENWAGDGIQGCPASLSSEDSLQQAGCDPEVATELTTPLPSLLSVVSLLGTLASLLFPSAPVQVPQSHPPALEGFSPSRTILQGQQRGEALPNPASNSWDDSPAAQPKEEQPLPLCSRCSFNCAVRGSGRKHPRCKSNCASFSSHFDC